MDDSNRVEIPLDLTQIRMGIGDTDGKFHIFIPVDGDLFRDIALDLRAAKMIILAALRVVEDEDQIRKSAN